MARIAAMEAYTQRRDTALRPRFEQTVAAAAARDDPYPRLDSLRAVLLNQHDVRILIRALPGLLDQVFERMDRFRHAFVAEFLRGGGRDPRLKPGRIRPGLG